MGVTPYQGTQPRRRLAVLANRRVQLANRHERIDQSQALESTLDRLGETRLGPADVRLSLEPERLECLGELGSRQSLGRAGEIDKVMNRSGREHVTVQKQSPSPHRRD